ncbi:MAG: aminotransferase class I/II-fold pyridoxal phosphate-dependent enzyme [Cyclobacteriaceae bacterium]|nr:aminotransferase class I/II-fold pyridoxal phosphate-dependent enzyme [Cyclobacteriaceae bacterium]MCB9236327.1 aminotransferase class I/II-fold pyridoxal phosphate-dependent enzyme [Flammeovirgaceae bacterium]
MLLRQNIKNLRPSATLAINEYSNELSRQGRKVYKLGFGQSPFPVPGTVVKELAAHAHEKDYLPVKGLGTLREAVAHYHHARTGLASKKDDVLIGPGSKELLYIAQVCFDGDLVVPAPSWVSYAPQAYITGKDPLWISTSKPKKLVDAFALEEFCTQHPGRNFMLILNYPSNPMGTSYTREELKSLAEVARKHALLIVSDEIYGELMHTGEHVSIASYYPEGTIVSSGLSKWCGAGGWRLGTFTFPENLRWLIDAMAVVASETFTATSAPIQYAAVKAFEFGPEVENYVVDCRKVLKAIAAYAYTELSSIGLSMPAPQGGFYLFPDFGKFRDRLAAKGINGSPGLCRALLEETGVALLPGADFGQPPSELSARLSYVDFDGQSALAYIKSKRAISAAEAGEVAPHVAAACKAIKDWLI